MTFRRKAYDELAPHTLETYYPTGARPPNNRPASAANDREYTEAELEFLTAMERYRRTRRRNFPTCCEVLAILVSCGYRKVEPAGELPQFK